MLDRRRLSITRSTRYGEIDEVQSLGQSFRGKYPYFRETRISLKHNVQQVDESLHAKTSSIRNSRFDRTPTCDKRTDQDRQGQTQTDTGPWHIGDRPTVYRARVASRGKIARFVRSFRYNTGL